MKTLFAINENFATSNFDVLTSEELNKVVGGIGPGQADSYWEDEYDDDEGDGDGN